LLPNLQGCGRLPIRLNQCDILPSSKSQGDAIPTMHPLIACAGKLCGQDVLVSTVVQKQLDLQLHHEQLIVLKKNFIFRIRIRTTRFFFLINVDRLVLISINVLISLEIERVISFIGQWFCCSFFCSMIIFVQDLLQLSSVSFYCSKIIFESIFF